MTAITLSVLICKAGMSGVSYLSHTVSCIATALVQCCVCSLPCTAMCQHHSEEFWLALLERNSATGIHLAPSRGPPQDICLLTRAILTSCLNIVGCALKGFSGLSLVLYSGEIVAVFYNCTSKSFRSGICMSSPASMRFIR